MTLTWAEFCSQRQGTATQYFPCPGATRTIMVCSHIWWTDQIALSLHNLGYNVLLHFPFYLLYTDPAAFSHFNEIWTQILATIRDANITLILGGNSSAIAVHPDTGELLHEAAKIPAINWWWDELRTKPPFATWPQGPGITPRQFLLNLASPFTLNAIWDIDVLEELLAEFQLPNLLHLPLATLPEYWPHGYIPLEDRPLTACFLGNCHFTADWIQTDNDPLIAWAREVVLAKHAAQETSMQACADHVTALHGGIPTNSRTLTGDPWIDFQRPWELVNAAWMHYTRNRLVQTAASHLKSKLALIGKGWDKLTDAAGIPLRANMEHAGDKSGVVYGQSQICLNLFGGCVHGGMPLRPFDIGASGGLIVTHFQRELPALFEAERECLAFRNEDEMLVLIDRIRSAPKEFNAIAQAGRQRVLNDHTWAHRLKKLMGEVESRFWK